MAATTPWDDTPPTIDERYISATETSDLTVGGGMIPKDHKAGPGLVIGAAGLGVGLGVSARSTGMALLRLHSEWTSSAKPRRVERPVIEVIAARIKAQDVLERETAYRNEKLYEAPGPALTRAHTEAQRWYTNELRLLAVRLKSRAAVIEQLTVWAAQKRIDVDLVPQAVHHWLAETCQVCDGHGFVRMVNEPALSTKRCDHCHGSGREEIPEGTGRLLKHIDYCLDQARGQLRERLQKTR